MATADKWQYLEELDAILGCWCEKGSRHNEGEKAGSGPALELCARRYRYRLVCCPLPQSWLNLGCRGLAKCSCWRKEPSWTAPVSDGFYLRVAVALWKWLKRGQPWTRPAHPGGQLKLLHQAEGCCGVGEMLLPVHLLASISSHSLPTPWLGKRRGGRGGEQVWKSRVLS